MYIYISEFCKQICCCWGISSTFEVEGRISQLMASKDPEAKMWFCLPRKKVRFLKKHFEQKKCEFFASVFVEILLLVIF